MTFDPSTATFDEAITQRENWATIVCRSHRTLCAFSVGFPHALHPPRVRAAVRR